MFQQTNQGICFKVKVIPKASRSELVKWEEVRAIIQNYLKRLLKTQKPP